MKRPQASGDVRERALAACDAGRSVADVATYYQVDPSTIRRWIRHRRATGSAHPRPRSGRPRVIRPDQGADLAAQVAAHPDATLAEHCAHWAERTGVRVGLSTMSRELRRRGLTRKKSP